MRKFILILLMIGLIACLFIGCDVTTPSEGEGEGEEEVSRVVMVELFTQPGCAYCEIAEPIIEQLADEYERSEVVFLEERAYGLYSLDEIRDRYEWYFSSSADRDTPNILFNGLNQRIHGSSSYASIKSKINLELGKEAKISITATRSSNSTATTISGTIKNISSSTLDNLVINGMTFKDKGQVGLKHCVLDIFTEQEESIATIAPGETYNFSFTYEGFNWEGNKIQGVVFVQAPESSKKEVLQALYVD